VESFATLRTNKSHSCRIPTKHSSQGLSSESGDNIWTKPGSLPKSYQLHHFHYGIEVDFGWGIGSFIKLTHLGGFITDMMP
jgi:hypothetical protein